MNDMKNNACAIAQDLMPLQLDNLCSEQSCTFLQEHMRTCAECRMVYQRMKKEYLPDPNVAEATANRAQWEGSRRYLKRRTLRAFLIGLLSALLIAALAVGGLHALWLDYRFALPLDKYDVELKQTSNGWVTQVWSFAGHEKGYAGGISGFYDGNGILYIQFSASRIPHEGLGIPSLWPEYYMHEGRLYEAHYSRSFDDTWITLEWEIKEIRRGTKDDYEVIYRTGDTLPPCSDAEEKAALQRLYTHVTDIPYEEAKDVPVKQLPPVPIVTP